MQYEVERKFRLVEPSSLLGRLAELEIDPLSSAPVQQTDRYFAHPARDFARTDEALRLRQVGDQNRLTYKGPKIDRSTKTRRELELPLAAGADSASQWEEMLTALGFHAVGVVTKHRRTARFSFAGWPVELAWDEVEGLGTFVELELVADESNLAAAQACLSDLVARLQLSGEERRSYLELLLDLA
ncbi:MAG TPA: class IV adenylate cyclase [Pirellulales bacterium]|jgi:adenylate cyclase class 2|nr:class IV adenylate cyclase [Pirellulales bacterium]